jgi:hypothetical protein
MREVPDISFLFRSHLIFRKVVLFPDPDEDPDVVHVSQLEHLADPVPFDVEHDPALEQ